MISVVVPVYNEERSVALLYDELRSALEPLHTSWEAIFVDDGSSDGTSRVSSRSSTKDSTSSPAGRPTAATRSRAAYSRGSSTA